MKKIENKSIQLLIFLAFFGFSVGLFNNYRELWMSANNLNPTSISRIISISYLVTILILFFFTLKVSSSKLKEGMTISLILKMITSTTLICLNNTKYFFLMKFMMFFDIAFTTLILSSIYPLIMKIAKNDLIYTKREVVESLSNKLGFLLVSILIGKTLFNKVMDYNTCFLLSVIFIFLAFIIFINIEIKEEKKEQALNLKEAFTYFKKNKSFILFLISNMISSITWTSLLGLPLLTLTTKLGFNTSTASFLILGLGIISNILALLIIKRFHFKNDHLNLIFKNGIRVILYFLIFLIGTKEILLITFIYLLLSDSTFNFILTGYYLNQIDEKYSLLLVVLKYCTALIGDSIGIILCGLVFHLKLKYLAIPSFLFGIIHYVIATILIQKKTKN